MPVVQRDVAELWWESEGVGPPVLLLGGLGQRGEAWAPVVERLAPRHQCIFFDARGTGRTGTTPGPYAIATLAADAAAILDDGGVDRVDVVGWSFGALVAAEVALSHPERVRTLVLAACPAGPDPVVLRADAESRGSEGDGSEGVRLQLEGATSWDGVSRLAAITAPTLVLHGSADAVVPVDAAEALAASIPGAVLRLLDGAGHVLFDDGCDDALKAIAEFWSLV